MTSYRVHQPEPSPRWKPRRPARPRGTIHREMVDVPHRVAVMIEAARSGMDPMTIAKELGIQPASVSIELSRARRAGIEVPIFHRYGLYGLSAQLEASERVEVDHLRRQEEWAERMEDYDRSGIATTADRLVGQSWDIPKRPVRPYTKIRSRRG